MHSYFIRCHNAYEVAPQLLAFCRPTRLSFQPDGLLFALNTPLLDMQSLHAHLQNIDEIRPFATDGFEGIIAESAKMQACLAQAIKFARLNAPLLLQGETGTGKDLLARACHLHSHRSEQKFIAVNCAGLPENEAESEMFGYRSDTKASTGFFEYANGGTVLLDAVSELSLEMQAKLLRFLNDGTFRRVGEDKEIRVDVRVICTSQQPLAQLVETGKMREDLYHRLNVLCITLPPLSERVEDIPALTAHFVAQICRTLSLDRLEYDQAFLNALACHSWRGNLRELYNAIYRACSLATNGKLAIADLNLAAQSDNEFMQENITENGTLDEIIGRFEAALLRKFYAQYPSSRKLAQRLGLSHTAIANKLRNYGIGK